MRFFLFFFIFSFISASAQEIEQIIEQTKNELAKEKDLEKQAILSGDLAWYYVQVNIDSAESYANKAMLLSKKIDNKKLVAQSYNDLGTVLMQKGEYLKSIEYCKLALSIRKELSDEEGMASVYFKLGNNFSKLSLYDSTMLYYFKCLSFYEKKGDMAVITNLESNISSTYYSMGNYTKALEYLERPIAYFKENSNYLPLSNCLLTLGNIQLTTKDTTGSLSSYRQAEQYAKEGSNLMALGAIYNNYSNIFTNRSQFDSAIYYIEKSIEIREELGLYSDLESSKLSLALNLFSMGQYEEAKPKMIKLKDAFESIESKDKLVEIYLALSYIYAYQQNTDSVQYYNELYNNTLNDLQRSSTLKISEEIEVQYQTEKKEKEILLQRAKLAEQKLYTIIVLALLLLSVIIGYLFFKQQKAKTEQLEKENQLRDALLKIETQNKLQDQRLQISRDLHDNIGAQLTFVISSIDSLKYVFGKENQVIEEKLSNISSFTRGTIGELRDTIWAMNKDNINIEDLKSRISNFVDNAKLSLSGIQFEFIYKDKDAKQLSFSSQDGMNIYRIIQEALNNAVKHSGASRIIVNFELKPKEIIVEISDNGKGISDQVVMGNGMQTMNKRSEELKAQLKVIPLGKGCQIQLIIPKDKC